MRNHKYHYLIIGQGLAGSILALNLEKRGKRVFVIDNKHEHSSSMVAAGIVNPITGHRLNITDGFFDYLPVAKQFYYDVSSMFAAPIWHDINQLRLIKTQGQLDYWHQRIQQEQYKGLLDKQLMSGDSPQSNCFRKVEHGVARVYESAYVDTETFLKKTQQYLHDRNALLQQPFKYDQLILSEEGVEYQTIRANSIIFCEGHQAISNPWLKTLPFKLAKGQILNLESDLYEQNRMLNWGHWLLPKAGVKIQLGSNFEWNKVDYKQDATETEKLLASMNEYTNIDARLNSVSVGVRPSTKQRKPFVGRIKPIPNAYCFNGFGSKGCLLIPYFAEMLSEHLLDKKPIPSEYSQWL